MRALALQRLGLARLDQDSLALTMPAMLALTVAGACLTGLMAQVRIYIPGVPVPITGQVFAVLLCGVGLGAGFGALSQLLYVAAGVAGMPWFTMGGFGLAYLAGPTGGYLAGFVAMAAFLGFATRRLKLGTSYFGLISLMWMAIGILYLFGTAHLMLILNWSFKDAFILGAAPFMAVDMVKVLAAAGIAHGTRAGLKS